MKNVFIILFALALMVSVGCKKNDAAKDGTSVMKVQAPGGLRMRETPDLNSKVVVLIPDGSEVSVVEVKEPEVEVAGKKGRWTKVSWKDTTGWAFGGFLAKSEGGSAGAGGSGLPSESDYLGKSLGPALAGMDQMDSVSFTLAKGGAFTAECLLGGSGKVKINGTYSMEKSGDYLVFTLKGHYDQHVAAETDMRKNGDFKDGKIRMTKKNGKLFGDVTIPQCPGYQGREIN